MSARAQEGDATVEPAEHHCSQTKTAAQHVWPAPVGYTPEDLERFLDLLYGIYSHVSTLADLRQVVVSDSFDRSEQPRKLKLLDLTDWLEALVS